VAKSDLGSLPEDEEHVPKRKSLKRLRKAKAKAEMAEANGDASDEWPPRFPRREWPGVEMMTFEAAAAAAAVVEGEGGDDGTALDSEVDPEVGTQESEKLISGQISSYVTTAARACVVNRDEMYISFMGSAQKTLTDIGEEHDKLESDEGLWKDNWEKMIDRLLSSTV
jgi:hypothetical protein